MTAEAPQLGTTETLLHCFVLRVDDKDLDCLASHKQLILLVVFFCETKDLLLFLPSTSKAKTKEKRYKPARKKK